jgi:hypothetical protein
VCTDLFIYSPFYMHPRFLCSLRLALARSRPDTHPHPAAPRPRSHAPAVPSYLRHYSSQPASPPQPPPPRSHTHPLTLSPHPPQAIADRALSFPLSSPPHEAAIYAALSSCSDLLPRALLPVCYGWEDCLWARLATGVGAHVAEQLRRRKEEGRQAEPMPMQVRNGYGKGLQGGTGGGGVRGGRRFVCVSGG